MPYRDYYPPQRKRWYPPYEGEYGYWDKPYRPPYQPPTTTTTGGGGGGTKAGFEQPAAPTWLWDWIKQYYGQGFDPRWISIAQQRLREGLGRERMGREKAARENLAYRNVYRGGLLPRAYERAADIYASEYAGGLRDIEMKQLEEQQRTRQAAIEAATRLFGIEEGYGLEWLNWLLNKYLTEFYIASGTAGY